MRQNGARVVPVSATQSFFNQDLLGGPVRLLGWSLNDGAATNGLTQTGTANAPAAGATIASISLSSGEYLVKWTVELTGTPGAADVDNVALFTGPTQIATSINLGAVGNYPQNDAQATVIVGPSALTAKAIGNAAVGSVYKVTLNITAINGSSCNVQDGNMNVLSLNLPQGGSDTRWIGDIGIEFHTSVSVQATLGVIQGALFCLLGGDDIRADDTKQR